jgi:hypothetical protein
MHSEKPTHQREKSCRHDGERHEIFLFRDPSVQERQRNADERQHDAAPALEPNDIGARGLPKKALAIGLGFSSLGIGPRD